MTEDEMKEFLKENSEAIKLADQGSGRGNLMTTFTYFLLIGFDWADKVETEAEAMKYASNVGSSLEVIYSVTEDRETHTLVGTDCTEQIAQTWWFNYAADKFDSIPAIFDPFIPQSEVAKYL